MDGDFGGQFVLGIAVGEEALVVAKIGGGHLERLAGWTSGHFGLLHFFVFCFFVAKI